jgi:hypothetical protein
MRFENYCAHAPKSVGSHYYEKNNGGESEAQLVHSIQEKRRQSGFGVGADPFLRAQNGTAMREHADMVMISSRQASNQSRPGITCDLGNGV